MFTKQHYQKIAEVIANAKIWCPEDQGDMDYNKGVAQVKESLADLSAADNPRFDREKFIQACK